MGAATILSITAMVAWLILDHRLWEQPKSVTERGRSALYNTATLVTLTIGVTVLHVALFVLLLGAAVVILSPQLFASAVGHPVGIADYLTLAWLLGSISTVGGALGSDSKTTALSGRRPTALGSVNASPNPTAVPPVANRA